MSTTGRIPLPPQVVRAVATALVRGDRAADAERLLSSPLLDDASAGDLGYELGRIGIERGAYEDAVPYLQRAVELKPEHPEARQLLGDTLRYLVGRAIVAKDWERARLLLEQACSLSPDDTTLRDALLVLAGVDASTPLGMSDADTFEQLTDYWEDARRANWKHPRATHELAMLYHRHAIEGDERGGPERDQNWHLAIANWAALIADDAFWQQWVTERASVYGATISPAQTERLQRETVRTQVEKVHRDFEQAYTQARDEAGAARHREYRSLLGKEIEAARACRDTIALASRGRTKVTVPLAAGPLLLAHLDLMDEARQFAQLAAREHSGDEAPRTFQRALGHPAAEISTRSTRARTARVEPVTPTVSDEPVDRAVRALMSGRPAEAIEILVGVLAATPGNIVARTAMALACARYGSMLLSQGQELRDQGDRAQACRRLARAEEVVSIGLDYAGRNASMFATLREIQQVRAAMGC